MPTDIAARRVASKRGGALTAIWRWMTAGAREGRLQAQLAEQAREIAELRARAEEAEHTVRLTEGLSGIGFWRYSPRRRERTWSPNMFAMLGLDPAKGAPADGAIGLFEPQDQAYMRDQAAGHFGDTLDDREYRVARPDGTVTYIRMSGVVERDAEGNVSHLYGAALDVTEARKRELALVESEARYRMLADSMQDIIVQYDAHGTIEFVSPSARRLGYDPADVLGRTIWSFGTETLARSSREALARYRDGAPFPQGNRVESEQQVGGASVWLESVETPLYDGEGRFRGVVAVMRDVTERRRLEDELRRKEAEAVGAMVAKSEFLANMSHEIRTPLTAVIGYAGLMAKIPDLPEKARVYADRVTRSGEALNGIVNNILDFSKVEAGQVVLRRELCAVADLVGDALGQVREAAEQKGLALAVEMEPPLPETVLVDRLRFAQVLLNLLTNAIKFTASGTVTVSLRHDARAERLFVAVTDTGVGISEDQGSRLFQRFSQVEGSNQRRFGGVGLGLAICRGLVELMDGEIGFESVEGVGSTFRFDLAAPAIANAPAAQACAAEAEPEAPTLRPLKILLADDLTTNRDLIAALLGPFSPDITEAADGAQAVEAAGREAFDLVLMDVQMPGMDGLAATRAIRANSPLNAGTPVIAISASVLPNEVEACREAGMNDHVAKPVNPRDLLSKIAAWTQPDPRRDVAA